MGEAEGILFRRRELLLVDLLLNWSSAGAISLWCSWQNVPVRCLLLLLLLSLSSCAEEASPGPSGASAKGREERCSNRKEEEPPFGWPLRPEEGLQKIDVSNYMSCQYLYAVLA